MHFDVALFTNLSRDHLDYHGDMASYAAAKATLFGWPGLQYAVLNLDDPFGVELAGKLGCSGVKVVGYGFEGETEGCQMLIKGRDLAMNENGMRFEVATPWGKASISSAMLGRFNASNLLGTLAVLLVSGIALETAVAALAKVEAVAGRVQQFGGAGKPLVVVDYAHTPDALEKVLQTLREIKTAGSRLICVFGCGGNRDKGKRPLMGAWSPRIWQTRPSSPATTRATKTRAPSSTTLLPAWARTFTSRKTALPRLSQNHSPGPVQAMSC